MFKKKDKDTTGQRMGGLSFFLAMFAFLLVGISNLVVLPAIIPDSSLARWAFFFLGILIGISVNSVLMRGEFEVLLHEFKHLFLASVVGNKVKRLKVGDETGHVQYSYTKETAHFNAMIALAPYWLPIFTIPACISLFTPFGRQDPMLIVLGICYGIDFISGYRDIGPHQTDISLIRGGYGFGLLYLLGAHLTVFTLLAAWVADQLNGLRALGVGLFNIVSKFVMTVN